MSCQALIGRVYLGVAERVWQSVLECFYMIVWQGVIAGGRVRLVLPAGCIERGAGDRE